VCVFFFPFKWQKFELYGQYINNMANAHRTLHFVRSANKNVRTVLLVLQQRSECGGKPLDELLSFPLTVIAERRRTLLQLLSTVVASRLSEENVPQLVESIALLDRMTSVAAQISDQEERHKLEMIERMIKGAKEANVIVRPNRKFVHRGVLTIASEKRYLFLFNDMVIVTKSLGKKGFDYEFKYVLEIEDCEVESAPLKHQVKGSLGGVCVCVLCSCVCVCVCAVCCATNCIYIYMRVCVCLVFSAPLEPSF
jgi:hypothetical protein